MTTSPARRPGGGPAAAGKPWWWWPCGTVPGQRPALFFPPAGADQTVLRPVLPQLTDLQLGLLRMPGRGPRREEPEPGDTAELVDRIATGIEDAVDTVGAPAPLLVGHSFGALLAHAVVQRLEQRGRRVARLVVLAAVAPAGWQAQLEEAGTPDPEEFVQRRTERLMREGGLPPEVVADPQARDAARRALSTDVRLSRHPFPTTPVRCPLTVVTARDDALVGSASAAGWAGATSGGLHRLEVPGDHFFYRTHPGTLAGLLRGELTALERSYDLA